jgi:hypothetical protein
VYGFPASQMLSCGIISATVCYLGRSEKAGLKRVVNALENDWPGTEIIYGDTVILLSYSVSHLTHILKLMIIGFSVC